jgi:hypothetical protein
MRTLAGKAALLLVVSACAGPVPGEGPVGEAALGIVGGTSVGAAYPEAALLELVVGGARTTGCTGALVAPSVILTAGHCVDGIDAWEITVAGQARFSTAGETYDWQEGSSPVVAANHHDLGLVYLSEPVVLAAYPDLARAPAPEGARAVNVGRVHLGVMTTELWGAETVLGDGAAAGFPFDYQAPDVIEHGDSGGPDFLAGTHTLVAVSSGAGGGVCVLARVDLVEAWIAAKIAAHGGTGAPAARRWFSAEKYVDPSR